MSAANATELEVVKTVGTFYSIAVVDQKTGAVREHITAFVPDESQAIELLGKINAARAACKEEPK